MKTKYIDFHLINALAVAQIETLVKIWVPNGQKTGSEWVALNPRRNDKKIGSFKINLDNGKWADFAIGKSGGDPISLYAYLFNLRQIQAAKKLAQILGVEK